MNNLEKIKTFVERKKKGTEKIKRKPLKKTIGKRKSNKDRPGGSQNRISADYNSLNWASSFSSFGPTLCAVFAEKFDGQSIQVLFATTAAECRHFAHAVHLWEGPICVTAI